MKARVIVQQGGDVPDQHYEMKSKSAADMLREALGVETGMEGPFDREELFKAAHAYGQARNRMQLCDQTYYPEAPEHRGATAHLARASAALVNLVQGRRMGVQSAEEQAQHASLREAMLSCAERGDRQAFEAAASDAWNLDESRTCAYLMQLCTQLMGRHSDIAKRVQNARL